MDAKPGSAFILWKSEIIYGLDLSGTQQPAVLTNAMTGAARGGPAVAGI